MLRCTLALSGWVVFAHAQVPVYKPSGLVLGNGVSIERSGRPAAPAKAGELLFSGDVVRTGRESVPILSCTENARFRLSGSAEMVVSEGEWRLKSGFIADRSPVSTCYLPESPKLSLASQQHFGALAARSGSIPPPTGTFQQRVDSVAEPRRTELKSVLNKLDSALRADPSDAGAHISRGTVLEQSGLLYDAGESYRTAAVLMPGAAWLRRKVIEIENRLLSQRR